MTSVSELDGSKAMTEAIFDILRDKETNRIPINRLFATIEETGIRLNDVRLADLSRQIFEIQRQSMLNTSIPDKQSTFNAYNLDFETFEKCISPNVSLMNRVVQHDFVIPEWHDLSTTVTEIYKKCKLNTDGKVADYIPQLARVNPDLWGVSICSIDGQRFSVGDADYKFSMQASQYPLAYSLAITESSGEHVHSYVGLEPSGLPYMALALNNEQKPHNPMITSGGIVIASLLQSQATLADRFDYVLSHYKKLAGDEYVGFNNTIFLSERESSNRNFAIGYILKEHKCFPESVNFLEVMDFYFQLCSIEITAESGSVMAATLANGGICPITGERVLSAEAVRDTLSLMHSCGMYDFSGQFAFRVGLPAKAAVSGAILVVVPNVMGICLFSPAVNQLTNSVRGIQFCEELVTSFNFHNYDSLIHLIKKNDPRRRHYERKAHEIVSLLFSAYNNDITALRRVCLRGIDMSQADYDGRTALHIAAAEGHLDVVRFLIEVAGVNVLSSDRWGFTPLSEAKRFKRLQVVSYIEDVIKTLPHQPNDVIVSSKSISPPPQSPPDQNKSLNSPHPVFDE